MPPYTQWCSISENFDWGRENHPLVFLDWIPEERRGELLERARLGGPFAVIGRRRALDDSSLDWLGDMASGQLNREEQGFVYKQQWWRTGNKAVETCDPVT
eukprot:474788-Rhodomonas_salina.1